MFTLTSTRRRSTLVAVIGLVLAAAVIVSVHALGAGSETVCPRTADPNWNPYDGTIAQAEACGLTVYPLTSTKVMPDGGTLYVYQGPKGAPITQTVPPKGLNLLTASATELAVYGLPAEPPVTNPIARAHWIREVGSMKSWVSPPPFLYSTPG
jgi:hypothetical protein